jgi:hypothetical protein
MENDFDLHNREGFTINPRVWLCTLLAITGDKKTKEEVVQRVARETGWPPEKVEMLMSTTIKILVDQTRSN